nr:MAG TPA: hypothetical protein [Caudoviricetes sp.]
MKYFLTVQQNATTKKGNSNRPRIGLSSVHSTSGRINLIFLAFIVITIVNRDVQFHVNFLFNTVSIKAIALAQKFSRLQPFFFVWGLLHCSCFGTSFARSFNNHNFGLCLTPHHSSQILQDFVLICNQFRFLFFHPFFDVLFQFRFHQVFISDCISGFL